MASWNDLLNAFLAEPDETRMQWWLDAQVATLKQLGQLRGDRHVLLYASAWLQKPGVAAQHLSIGNEDVNGLMSCIYGMTWDAGLTIVLHTPGGSTNATETVVEYLRSKFDDIEVVVPTFAMSAGTMISLAADRVIMGRQSQLGPIDPQITTGQATMSARGIVDQFDAARRDILGDPSDPTQPGDINAAHLWAPLLQSAGPSLLQEAKNALAYSEGMVCRWLEKYMLAGDQATAADIARHFNDAGKHKSHGRRIDRDEARGEGVLVEDLEPDQALQEAVLTAYHLATIAFEHSPAAKMLIADTGQLWLKNVAP